MGWLAATHGQCHACNGITAIAMLRCGQRQLVTLWHAAVLPLQCRDCQQSARCHHAVRNVPGCRLPFRGSPELQQGVMCGGPAHFGGKWLFFENHPPVSPEARYGAGEDGDPTGNVGCLHLTGLRLVPWEACPLPFSCIIFQPGGL